MRRTPNLLFRSSSCRFKEKPYNGELQAVVRINNGTFYRKFPSSSGKNASPNPSLFPKLTFSIPSFPSEPQHWAVIGPSNAGKTTFFEVLRGQHLCFPPNARSYPYISSAELGSKDPRLQNNNRAIQYVGFNGEGGGVGRFGTRGAYLSARYESRREDTDFSVMDYLRGTTELNPSGGDLGTVMDEKGLDKVIKDLRLEAFVNMPMGNLSNGQTRRARIAKAILHRPELLLLDEPFMGLDPPTLTTLSPLLHKFAKAQSPRLVLSLRPQDPLPEWITHLVYLGPYLKVDYQGEKKNVLEQIHAFSREQPTDHGHISSQSLQKGEKSLSKETPASVQSEICTPPPTSEDNDNDQNNKELPKVQESTKGHPKKSLHPHVHSREGILLHDEKPPKIGEPVVEMENVLIKYGDKQVLGGWKQDVKGHLREGLWWTVRRGERWGIFGPNGSGKTTLLALICSDHPQSYSLPIRIFGRGRLPRLGQPGISIFDIQARIGQSSPEIHAFFPRNLTIRQTLQNAWADTFLGTPQLSDKRCSLVDHCLRWFESELNPGFRSDGQDQSLEYAVFRSKSTHWADTLRFGDAPFSSQRVALFLRALVKKPDLVVLDEAFSGMDESVRDKCMLFLAWGGTRHFRVSRAKKTVVMTDPRVWGDLRMNGLTEEQALICVSHVKEEVPGLVREWMCLPEAVEGNPPQFGRFAGPLEGYESGWNTVWQT